jgi:hypothetical protein
MGSLRKRYAILNAVAMKMLEEGKYLTKHEYDNCLSVPIRSALILNHFNNWGRLIAIIKTDLPEVAAQIENKSKPIEPVKPVKPIEQAKPKVDPLSALSKAKETKDAISE